VSSGIEARGVRRTFGDVVAVDNITLTAHYGRVTGLVGPNGAGKTTLLLMLATLLTPDAGELTVAGHSPVYEPRAVRAAMGWMPDAFGSYDSLTVREALQFAAAAYRMSAGRSATRVRELLDVVHLTEYADRPVHVLSRGQKQRLGLARAVVHDPIVLLLDEPAAGLDPRSRVELRLLMRDWANAGKAVLVSSHVLAELEQTADRVVFVASGRTVSEDDLADLREQRRPWVLRALDMPMLLQALDGRGIDFRPTGANDVEVLLAGDEAAADLVADLVTAGVRLVSCAPAGSSLEAAYLSMEQERR
jgi:ABC-2 type transport system ATP-binding protein